MKSVCWFAQLSVHLVATPVQIESVSRDHKFNCVCAERNVSTEEFKFKDLTINVDSNVAVLLLPDSQVAMIATRKHVQQDVPTCARNNHVKPLRVKRIATRSVTVDVSGSKERLASFSLFQKCADVYEHVPDGHLLLKNKWLRLRRRNFWVLDMVNATEIVQQRKHSILFDVSWLKDINVQ